MPTTPKGACDDHVLRGPDPCGSPIGSWRNIFRGRSTFEPATVIHLGRRAARRRRLTYAAGVAGLAAVAVVVGLTLGNAGRDRAVTPPAGRSASATTNPGTFGAPVDLKPGGKDEDDPDALASYTVQGVDIGGVRSVVLTEVTDSPGHELTRLNLDEATETARIVFNNGAQGGLPHLRASVGRAARPRRTDPAAGGIGPGRRDEPVADDGVGSGRVAGLVGRPALEL